MRAFRVAYDGRSFHGFQRQPDVPTVEGTLFSALRSLGVLGEDADRPDGYAAAGRTDAGVSAVAQTVAFECPDWCTPAALNSQLPGDVRAWASADAPPDFHATHDAASREYVYVLYAPESELDDARARAAFDALRGEHDFHNLTPDDAGTVRAIDGDLRRDGDFLLLRVEAGGFARELVRRLVSLVRAVGTGASPRSKIDRVLGPEPIDGPAGVPPAPATPLVLSDVAYPALSFAVDPDAAATAREVFDERRVEGLTRARVAETVLDRIDG
jgi:tRNA pseudouridine38-40 synthase